MQGVLVNRMIILLLYRKHVVSHTNGETTLDVNAIIWGITYIQISVLCKYEISLNKHSLCFAKAFRLVWLGVGGSSEWSPFAGRKENSFLSRYRDVVIIEKSGFHFTYLAFISSVNHALSWNRSETF